jgi:hypothetical protein
MTGIITIGIIVIGTIMTGIIETDTMIGIITVIGADMAIIYIIQCLTNKTTNEKYMYKKTLLTISCSLLLMPVISTFAMPSPRYLAVNGFDQCMETRHFGPEQVWCMPDFRPAFCHHHAWDQLTIIAVQDEIPSCHHIDMHRGDYHRHDHYYPTPSPRPVVVVPGPVIDIHFGHHDHHDDHHDNHDNHDHHDDHHDNHDYPPPGSAEQQMQPPKQ